MRTFTSIVLLFFIHLHFSFCQVNASDSLAMVDFYENLNGDNWNNNTNWLSSQPMTQWYGIEFEEGRLVSIDMKNNNCVGYIGQSLSNCTKLEEIFLLENEISGIADLDSFPEMFTINISTNALTEFPSFIVKCENLERLNLYDNEIEGNVPAGLDNLIKMYELTLSKNRLKGEFPSLKNLDQLITLDLSLNKELSGDLQDILYDSLSIINLNISYSELSGEFLPTYFDKEEQLRLFADSSGIDGVDKLEDFTISKCWIRQTDLGFSQLEAIQNQNTINQYYYSPQNDIQAPEELIVSPGIDVSLSCLIEGADDFQWYKDGFFIQGEKAATLELEHIEVDNEGAYHCTATQSSLPLLILYQTPTNVMVQTTKVEDEHRSDYTVFPNPASEYIELDGVASVQFSYVIIDASGRTVKKGNSSQKRINVESIEKGWHRGIIQPKGTKEQFTFSFFKL